MWLGYTSDSRALARHCTFNFDEPRRVAPVGYTPCDHLLQRAPMTSPLPSPDPHAAHAHVRSLQRSLVPRLAKNGLIVLALVTAAVGVGAAGYHYLAHLSWLDAALNAAMILTGMGPVNKLVTPAAKVFAIGYSLFSGVFFLTMVAVLLAPAANLFMHRFHLEVAERESRRNDPPH